ncbi:MAG: hypothetical protein QOH39_3042 [Verrucomicrobiota bacterium]
MRDLNATVGTFQKVGECLYRYSSNGVYYARIKVNGKDLGRHSLETTDPALARRNLSKYRKEQSQIDQSKAKMTLAALGAKYLQTVGHLGHKTVERKAHIVRRLQNDWPNGSSVQVSKIRTSDILLWLGKYQFGPVSRNQHLAQIRSILEMAVSDGIIATNPADGIPAVKLSKPIRETPTWEMFRAIVADVRAQRFMADAEESGDFLEFLGSAGLGQAEAAALRWSDIDFEQGKIRTFRHKTKSGFVIPLYPQVRELLERRRKSAGACGNNETVFHQKNARKALAGACRRLGLPAFTQRALRRCFIVRAIQKGISVPVIAQFQAHKDGGKLILSTYSHVDNDYALKCGQLLTDEAAAMEGAAA